MRKCWYPAFFPFFTTFSIPLIDQSHSLIHILFVLCRRFRLMSLRFYCLVIHISHKTLEIYCAWSKGSGERLQVHHGPLVYILNVLYLLLLGKLSKNIYFGIGFLSNLNRTLFHTTAPSGRLSDEHVGLLSVFETSLRQTFSPAYVCLSPLLKFVRKAVGGFGKKVVSTGVRKPGASHVCH